MKKTLRTFTVLACLLFLFSVVLAQNSVEKAIGLFEDQKYGEAKEIFEQLVKSDSDNAQANYYLGRIYLSSDDHDKAKDYLEKAVELDEQNLEYHLELAAVYRAKTRGASFLTAGRWAGKWKGELENAFEIDPRNIEARKRLISYYLNAPAIGGGDKEKGKKLAEETIALDEVEGRLLLGSAFRRTGQSDLAKAEYEKVIKLDPQNGEAYNFLGYLYLKQDEYDTAELHFKKYVEVDPDNPNAYDSLGDCYSERGMIDDAIAQYQMALEIDSTFSPSRKKLQEAIKKQDNARK